MKYYVVSDIHGYYDLLIDSLKEQGFFDDKKPHKLIIIGDYFDRGLQAKEVQKFICDLIAKDMIILVRGNHEDLVEEFLENIDHYTLKLEDSHHFRNSTVDTCCQLTGYTKEKIIKRRYSFVKKMKSTDFFRKILPKTINYYETKNYIFTHGYIPSIVEKYGREGTFVYDPNWRSVTDKQRWIYARWYNGMKAHYDGVKEANKTIVVGHWHCSFGHCYYENSSEEFGDNANYKPYYADGIIAIDGCVPRSFHINCIVIEDEDL